MRKNKLLIAALILTVVLTSLVFVSCDEKVVSYNVTLETGEEPALGLSDVTVLEKAPGLIVIDDPANHGYPTALECADKDEVFVGRIRRDFTVDSGVNLWVVADNIRKGAASNAVQIAEYMIAHNKI